MYGQLIGQNNANNILNSGEFVVQYHEGTEGILTHTNVFEHCYIQIYEARNQIHIYSEIVGHQKRNFAVDKNNQLYDVNS